MVAGCKSWEVESDGFGEDPQRTVIQAESFPEEADQGPSCSKGVVKGSIMCKLCNIEHSSRWTCAQARANYEDWMVEPPEPKPDVQTFVPSEVLPKGGFDEIREKWKRKHNMYTEKK